MKCLKIRIASFFLVSCSILLVVSLLLSAHLLYTYGESMSKKIVVAEKKTEKSTKKFLTD